MVRAMGGQSLPFRTSWRFVSGLGMNHVLETGFVWHHTLSVPYLPGSAVKGLIRAWIDPASGWAEVGPDPGDRSRIAEDIARLFGAPERGVGSIVVFDALPVKPPSVELDIMNVHHKRYYQGGGDPPSDYEDPSIIYFLTVATGQEFEFAFAPRSRPQERIPAQADVDVKRAFALLAEALAVLGAGAKTASGYGRFEPVPDGPGSRP
jgi:CRISPR-associated protein Cmr6